MIVALCDYFVALCSCFVVLCNYSSGGIAAHLSGTKRHRSAAEELSPSTPLYLLALPLHPSAEGQARVGWQIINSKQYGEERTRARNMNMLSALKRAISLSRAVARGKLFHN